MERKLRDAGIVSLGTAVPPRVVTNADMERLFDTSDEWIRSRTGIRERHIADPEVACSDLATEAARKALERASVSPDQVDLVIVATVTPDYYVPSAACLVQDRLGATRAAAFDINAACPGFIYGISVARQFVATGAYDTVVVVGSEVLSRVADPQDRGTYVLFGDAAGAAVVRPVSPGRGILASVLGSDGSGAPHLIVPAGGSRRPASSETVEKREHYLRMNGQEVFRFAVRVMEESSLQVLERCGLNKEDINLLVPHQANIRIIESARKRLGLPPEKVVVNVDRYGNTSSASIPIALEEALTQGRLHDGDLVVGVAFGAGLTWGSVAMRWGS